MIGRWIDKRRKKMTLQVNGTNTTTINWLFLFSFFFSVVFGIWLCFFFFYWRRTKNRFFPVVGDTTHNTKWIQMNLISNIIQMALERSIFFVRKKNSPWMSWVSHKGFVKRCPKVNQWLNFNDDKPSYSIR